MRNEVLFSILLSWVFCSQLCSAGDTLSASQMITENSSSNFVSTNHTFELGFFNLSDRSENRYLGIWYHRLEPQTVVWIANRDEPVLDSSGVFRISENGNLVVEGKSWSSQLETSSSTNRTVRILDTGNLVLMDGDGNFLWQSFLNPTDTFLPGMKMDANLTLTSWRHATDPARGAFTFKLDHTQSYKVEKQSKLYWVFDGLVDTEANSPMILQLLANNSSHKNAFAPPNLSHSRLVMNYSGEIQFLKWNETKWDNLWMGPLDKCDRHNYCGSGRLR
ncbi:hypothetical protein Fmac_019363 [Flemingia macrophylla]|uniref:non-specific serine/threonine protein kinase n=1 Tax=Flemingia macrophylla TaxID=520843 RepID=A0ABD1M7L3_9FABA